MIIVKSQKDESLPWYMNRCILGLFNMVAISAILRWGIFADSDIVEYFIYIVVIIVLRFNFKGSSSPTGLQTGDSPSRRLFGL